jgi:hypothetical protein
MSELDEQVKETTETNDRNIRDIITLDSLDVLYTSTDLNVGGDDPLKKPTDYRVTKKKIRK